MALLGLRRGDFTVHGIGNEEGFAVRWHRLLLALENMPGIHLSPAASDHVPAAPEGHFEPMLPAPLDAETALPGSDDLAGAAAPQVAADGPAADLIGLLGDAGFDNVWHPPYFLSFPLDPGPAGATAVPDHPPAEALLPKTEVVMWSGPALMIFPGEPHETSENGAAPDSGASSTASAPASDVAGSPPETAAAPDAPDTAGMPDAVTRDDLDPVLAAMGSGHDLLGGGEGAPGGAAFLPPDADDLSHGLVSGMVFTPPPIPPPPDGI